MQFPPTRLTLLGRLRQRESTGVLTRDWGEFHEIYHKAVRECIRRRFQKSGLNVQDSDLDEIVIDVFLTFYKKSDSFEYNPCRGQFRGFLATLCHRRTVDFQRKQCALKGNRSMEIPGVANATEIEYAEAIETKDAYTILEAEEIASFRSAALAALVAELQKSVGVRVFRCFEEVRINCRSIGEVAAELGETRKWVDNNVTKAKKRLRELALRPEYKDELL
jgi:RNA polymerase sigma factor (sigma-70 family)